MIESTYEQIEELCTNSGLEIAEKHIGIGREITYTNDPERTVVIHFTELEYPEIVSKTLSGILVIESKWILLNRYGSLSIAKYNSTNSEQLVDTLIKSWAKVGKEGDDLYLIGSSGTILLSYDHHIFNDGMAIYLSDIAKTEVLLIQLNKIGAEFEVFSKHG